MCEKAKTLTSEIKQFIGETPHNKFSPSHVSSILWELAEEMNCTKWNVNDFGSTLLITIKDTKSKTARKFSVTGKYYEICKR